VAEAGQAAWCGRVSQYIPLKGFAEREEAYADCPSASFLAALPPPKLIEYFPGVANGGPTLGLYAPPSFPIAAAYFPEEEEDEDCPDEELSAFEY